MALLAQRFNSSVAPARRSRRVTVSVKMFKEGMADVPPNKAQPMQPKVQTGSTIPMQEKAFLFKPQDSEPREVTVGEVFKGKKAVLFGLPGAYTSVCSSKHVPEYFSKAQELHAQGVELIVCTSVNDPYVMREWAEDLKVDQNTILMLADGDASFHKAMGLTQTLPGLGERARRYSMFLEDGKIKVLNIEEPGGKSYKVSGPSYMLGKLQELGK